MTLVTGRNDTFVSERVISVTFTDRPEPLSEVALGFMALSQLGRRLDLLVHYRDTEEAFRRTSLDDEIPYISSSMFEVPEALNVRKLMAQSPLAVELVGTPAVVWLLYWILKRPEELGSWLPRLVAGWRTGWDDNQRLARDGALSARLMEHEGDTSRSVIIEGHHGSKAPARLTALIHEGQALVREYFGDAFPELEDLGPGEDPEAPEGLSVTY